MVGFSHWDFSRFNARRQHLCPINDPLLENDPLLVVKELLSVDFVFFRQKHFYFVAGEAKQRASCDEIVICCAVAA